jgi:hypothetical protein
MKFDLDFIRHRAIITTDEESLGVTFTHWGSRRKSWSVPWNDVVAINAIGIESPDFTLGLKFLLIGDRTVYLSDDMEKWDTLIEVVRKRYPDFNWSNLDMATHYQNRNQSFPCWKRSSP